MRMENIFCCIALQLWCPEISQQVRQWVHSCTHNLLENSTYHSLTFPLHMLDSSDLFDLIYVGVWSPVDMPKKCCETKLLRSMEYITGLVDSAAIKY